MAFGVLSLGWGPGPSLPAFFEERGTHDTRARFAQCVVV